MKLEGRLGALVRAGRGLVPLALATAVYVALLAVFQPFYAAGRTPAINPSPMLYAVALIRTPRGQRWWVFPFVLAGTFLSARLGAFPEVGADNLRLAGGALSRAAGMYAFILILQALGRGVRIDVRRPNDVAALAAAMAGSILLRSYLLPLVLPPSLLAGAAPAMRLLRAFVPPAPDGLVALTQAQTAGFLGVMTLAPPVLLLTGSRPPRMTGRTVLTAGAASLLLVAVAWWVFDQKSGSLFFVLVTAIVPVAFYGGSFGAALGVLTIGAAAIFIQAANIPTGVITVLDTEKLAVQLCLTATTGVGLLVSGAVAQRNRLMAQLEAAKTAAENAADARAQFVETMSHEVRSPLAIVTLLTSALRKSMPSDDERAGMVDIIDRAGRQVLELLNGVLSYRRFEAVGPRVERRPVSVTQLVEELASTLAVQAAEHGVAIETKAVADRPDLVVLDKARAALVLTNLVANASHHARSKVTIAYGRLPGVERLRIAVTDDGPGLPLEARARIFERFHRETGHEESGRFGLGLAICRELVALQGGEIGVDSIPGENTTFWFELPIGADPA